MINMTYNFSQVFEYLRQGCTITSVVSEYSYMIQDNQLYYYSDLTKRWLKCKAIDFEEMIGEWTVYSKKIK